MQVSVDWLKEYAPVQAGTHDVAERLTMTLNEVDEVRSVRGLEDIVVGEIVVIEPHPNADRLNITKVATGSARRRTIVCGADNIEVGQRVPVAVPGTVLPSGLAIERRDVRGITSDGMLCSARELDVGEDHSGIWILPSDAKVGVRLPAAIGRRHDTFELEVLANRPDCMGHLGIAREVAAGFGVALREPRLKTPDRAVRGSYQVQHVAGCSRYSLAHLQGVENRESPEWLRRRLTAVGLRPVNAIVDVTNFVMLEYAQPLHAMDASKVEGNTVKVRQARGGERVATLDGETRKVPAGALLIADRSKALGFAGIMGAANCEIEDGTTDILLECAHFDPATIRRTSRALGLRTDASARFERGVSEALVRPAIRRAIDLILEICGGSLAQLSDSYPKPARPRKVGLSLRDAAGFLGVSIPAAAAKKILKSLGFTVSGSGDAWQVTVPYWRTDVREPVDLYEELIRHHGYERVPTTLPEGSAGAAKRPETVRLADRLQELLVAAGFTEALTHSLVGTALLERSGFSAKLPEIANPLSDDHRYLRGSLGPRHLEAVQANLRWRRDVRMFEIGRVFESTALGTTPDEQRKLMITAGTKVRGASFETVRGVLTLLLDRLKAPREKIRFKGVTLGKFVPGRHFQVWIGNVRIGWIAEFRFPDRFKAGSISMLSINLDRLPQALSGEWRVQMPPAHPPIYRDLSVYLPEQAPFAELAHTVTQNGKPHLTSVGDPDLFVHKGRRSITVPLEFRAEGRTLTDGEVNRLMANIEAAVKSRGWEVRT
ncbi:MAG: phenylalanine--tRNA ligase subunit beta [bacterium]|nr:phenylalanine--tRNA ligase subunit beta [bacterium]